MSEAIFGLRDVFMSIVDIADWNMIFWPFPTG